MRFLLAALCALAISIPAPAAGAALAAAEPKRRIYTPTDAAREMRSALRPPRAAPRKPVTAARRMAVKPKKPIIKRAFAPAKRPIWKATRSTWRTRRHAGAGRRRWARGRAAPATLVRQPYEPPPPVFIGDLHIQTESAPLWSSPAGGQLLGRLPRATIVTNMGRYGGYYKIEAPNGAVGFVPMRQVGPTAPSW